ncbi:MAG: GntR family transcriptional regulator [Magnetospirillum sp.]|nr:GntR family transcriptional regulator [Magnetospirillum sp.]
MKLQKTNLAEQSYGVLHEMLLAGQRFMPGDKISVEDLARQLGVSRSPVWGAIARLEAEGIVEVRPRQGVFFIGFDKARLLEIFVAREVLEGATARLAAEKINSAQMDELRRSIERQRAAIASGAIADYSAEATRFHQLLADAAGNQVMAEMVERLWARTKAMCIRPNARPALLDERIDEHARIIEAVAHRDGDTAEAETRAHIRRVAAGLKEL